MTTSTPLIVEYRRYNYTNDPNLSDAQKREISNSRGKRISGATTVICGSMGGTLIGMGVMMSDSSAPSGMEASVIAAGVGFSVVTSMCALLFCRYVCCPEKKVFYQGCGPKYIGEDNC